MFSVSAFMSIHGISMCRNKGLKLGEAVGTQELVVTMKTERK